MSMLLLIVGGIAVLAGIVMAGFGIPISDFSFGNTLISAGTTAIVGGLIVFGLGVVISKLQQIADALGSQAFGAQAPARPSRMADAFEAPPSSRAAPARVSFPSKPKSKAESEPTAREPRPLEARVPPLPKSVPEEETVKSVVPTLPNPDVPPVTLGDEASLSPLQPLSAPTASDTDFGEPAPSPFKLAGPKADAKPAATPQEPPLSSGWRPAVQQGGSTPRRQPNAFFKAMWSDNKAAKSPSEAEPPFEPAPAAPPPRNEAPVVAPPVPAEPETPAESAPRNVAVLKSGVVDGMAYTLYVDGSIEAELPQGTLRFASINELRSHLEKNSDNA
jgi:hypothetical protein